MKTGDLPAYITEVRETLQNHCDLGAIVMAFSTDPTNEKAVLSTGSMFCTLEALEAGRQTIDKAIDAMLKEMKNREIPA